MTKRLFFDVETTGTDERKHSIIQLAGLVEIDGEIKETFNFKMKPHPKAIIEPEALKVNGVTLEELETYDDPNKCLGGFKQMLGKYVNRFDRKDKFHLIGYNNRKFDDVFLRKWFSLYNDKFFGAWFWNDSHDVLVMASVELEPHRAELPSFKLNRVATRFGIDVNKGLLHDALYDVKLTREIYNMIRLNNDLF